MSDRGWRQHVSPKLTTSTNVPAGGATLSDTYAMIDMRDSASYMLVVENESLTETMTVLLSWYLDSERIVLFKQVSFNVPPGTTSARVQGPAWAPYLQINIGVLQGALPYDVSTYLFGQNLDLQRDILRIDDETSGPDILLPDYFTKSPFVNKEDWAASFVAANVAAEALFTGDIFEGPLYNALSANTYTVPDGRTLRIESVDVQYTTAAAATFGTFRLRETNLAGDMMRQWRVQNGAAGHNHVTERLANGMDFPGPQTIAFTRAISAAAATNVLLANLAGFLYDTVPDETAV